MLFDSIILTCLNQIKVDRTIFSVFHLLKGKKSIQTIQDARLYRLENYYGIHPTLTREDFKEKIQALANQRKIQKVSSNPLIFIPTNITEKNKQVAYQFYGLTYTEYANLFYHRLLLFVQTVTNSKMGYFSFIPIIEDQEIGLWVKQLYRYVKGKESVILKTIYDELYILLSSCPEKDRNIYIDRLTGYKRYGLSLEQLSFKYKLSKDDILLTLMGMNHQMVHLLRTENNNFPFLSRFISDVTPKTQMTTSSFQTYQLMKKGYSLEKVADVRNLKLSTIYDHMVEIALSMDDFPLHHFVNEVELEEILNALNTTNSYKLKDIKSSVSDSISYFQIRLVLAVYAK